MLVHSVFFWLKSDLGLETRAAFAAGLETLKGISAAEAVHVGTPADTPARPVIDATYDFALTVILEDMAAHDAYQQNPLHQRFLEDHAAKWDAVRIYDAD